MSTCWAFFDLYVSLWVAVQNIKAFFNPFSSNKDFHSFSWCHLTKKLAETNKFPESGNKTPLVDWESKTRPNDNSLQCQLRLTAIFAGLFGTSQVFEVKEIRNPRQWVSPSMPDAATGWWWDSFSGRSDGVLCRAMPQALFTKEIWSNITYSMNFDLVQSIRKKQG